MSRRVGVDLRALQDGFKAHKTRGIGVYTGALMARRDRAPAGLALAPFHDPKFEAELPSRCGSAPLVRTPLAALLDPWMKEYVRQHTFLKGLLTRHAREQRLDAIFFPSHLDAPSGLPVPTVVTAHDMIQRALMEIRPATFKDRLHVRKQCEVLRQAARIIAVSAHTADDVVRYAGVDRSKIEVIHNGVDPLFRRLDRAGDGPVNGHRLPERFVLNVGGIDWRKNVELLFDSFSRLLASHPDLSLVMTGAIENDPRYAGFKADLTRRGLADRVVAPGYVSPDDLVRLYNRCEVFFYPSVYEGFGLPVAEAMACGAPVISTNVSSIPEVAGDAALLFDPARPDDFADGLRRVIEEPSLRRDLSEKGIERAARFDWNACAEAHWQVLSGEGG
ncbi:MAG: glycosyltransferase family 4 protein [Nitrospinae bacterium]|nr:glycosyltransferase family 4 protein [Nitrospinota bacterium]